MAAAATSTPQPRKHRLWNQWLNSKDTGKVAGPLEKYIQPEQRALPLTARTKFALAGWEQIQPYAFGTQILAAGWSHLLNTDPKYGTDSAGFGERLGAANLRQNSQAILADGLFSSVFHQDPRYYRKGSGGLFHRTLYAATRVVVTRTDSGRKAPNYSELVGYLGASILTKTYYPAVSATWPKTFQGYGVSMAGSALGNAVHEFLPEAKYIWFRLSHGPPSDESLNR